jgi:hypothetical protein
MLTDRKGQGSAPLRTSNGSRQTVRTIQFFGVAALSDRSVWAVGEWSNSQGPTHTLVEYFC